MLLRSLLFWVLLNQLVAIGALAQDLDGGVEAPPVEQSERTLTDAPIDRLQKTRPDYEARLLQWGLDQHGREIEPHPEGKTVEEVLVAAENVFTPDDALPTWVNLVHVRTRESVIRREVLIREGVTYSEAQVRETERILRGMEILNTARVVPVKGRAGGIGILVVTQDRWSLRLNWDLNFVGPLLQLLRLTPTEINLFGLDHKAMIDFIFELDTLSIGEAYHVQRPWGTGLAVSESVSLIFNRSTLALEGSTGGVQVQHPFRRLDQKWAFTSSATWSVYRQRVHRGAFILKLPYPDATAPVGEIPYIYDVSSVSVYVYGQRSFGETYKTRISAGPRYRRDRYRPASELNLDETQSIWMTANHLGNSETAHTLDAEVRAFEARYAVLRDFDTYQLSEDYQLGYNAILTASWADAIFFSPARYVTIGAGARYRWYWFDDLTTITIAGQQRLVDPRGPAPFWANRRFAAEIYNLTPKVLGGRFATRAMIEIRRRELGRSLFLLGGGNGLRGEDPEALQGRNLFLMNLEYRSKPLEWRNVFLGGVLFFDSGSAFDNTPLFTHTVGGGLRILFPQFNRGTIRLDVGYVIGRPLVPSFDRVSGSFGQVTDIDPPLLENFF